MSKGRQKRFLPEPAAAEVEAAAEKLAASLPNLFPGVVGWRCDCDVCGVEADVEATEEQCPVGWYYLEPLRAGELAPTVCSDACRAEYERRALESLRLRWRGHVVVADSWQ